MTTSKWNKFVLLMWKNWKLQWRYKIQTIVEILVPVLFSALLIVMRTFITPYIYDNSTNFEPLSVNNFSQLMHNDRFKNLDLQLAYSPKNDVLEDLMRMATYHLSFGNPLPKQNSEELENYLVKNKTIAGIVFDDDLRKITELPEKLNFKIRFPGELREYYYESSYFNWNTDILFPRIQQAGPRSSYASEGADPSYYSQGFLHIQHAISKSFIESKLKNTIPDLLIQRYPYPPYKEDILIFIMQTMYSMVILLSFIYPCINTVKFITNEKEKQLKETMKIMGLPNWLHWTAWFVKTFIYMVISITLMVIFLKITAWYKDPSVSVFTNSDGTALWFFLLFYSIATIMYCFMISAFFSKATTAAAVAGLCWFLFYAYYSFTVTNYEKMPLVSKMFGCFFSNSAMGFGILLILRWEGTGEGLQWNNLFSPVTPDDNFSVGLVIVMFIVSSCLYLLITLYIEKVMPGEFGVPFKWYFPFTKEFWCAHEYNNNIDIENLSYSDQDLKNMEQNPIGMNAGIQIKNLRKVYATHKVAVQGLSMNMYEDQITVLLGHNGAGKTTTMSMLTGMFPATSGTAIINNRDIRSDIDGVRGSLGLCPQHNILFDELTVKEHIIFFSKLKGLNNKEIDDEINKYVNLLELQPKKNSFSSTLSGGMKRKLSVAVALCGKSKVVLLDEPTSGMDPSARRFLWDLLQKEKKGRTILLSTHFMDEADILGDRIAIMADGELKAMGSSFYLKKKFGLGYHLICVKSNNCKTNSVTALLKNYVEDITIETDIGTELSYQLSEKHSAVFQTMLKDLEDHSNELGIIGYGISLTTLEEVFLKVGSDGNNIVSETEDENLIESSPLLKGIALTINQIQAMFEKKMLYTLRNWIVFLLQIIIPVMYLALTLLVGTSISDLPELKIDINPYKSSVTVLDINPKDSSTSEAYKIAKGYEALFPESDHKLTVVQNTDMESYIIELGKTIQNTVNQKYLIGATINSTNITAWFNNQPLHTAPLTLNLVHNAILKGSDATKNCQIDVTNQPLPFNVTNMVINNDGLGFALAMNTGVAMSFVSAFYILFYIKERVSRSKLLQYVSGAQVFIFWITAYLWDIITFFITIIVIIITFAILQEDGWSSASELGRIMLILFFFGFSMLPFTYLASYLFTIPSTGFTRMALINIITGIACFIIYFVLMSQAKEISESLTWLFLLFPHFSLSQGLNNLNVINRIKKECEKHHDCSEVDVEYFDWKEPGIGRNIVFLYIMGIVTFTLLMIIEYGILNTLFYKCKSQIKKSWRPQPPMGSDADVFNEKTRIANMSMAEIRQNNLVIKDLTKYYKNFMAVKQISVGVNHSECFGLLGINGAGKTSMFKMLTGDEDISSGEAWVKGISLKNNMNGVHKHIGYCPQFDALIEDLTGRETLKMYCLLRGVPRQNINNISIKLATELNFMQHIDKQVKEYSGGNKRKLSTAISLIGNPSVVYLDEPTTGLDPGAKRQLWNMVCKIRSTGKSIILTSHSMEECEALCTRLAIMVNGEFKCIGSTQYLKNKFSEGFLLTIKTNQLENNQSFSNGIITSSVTANFSNIDTIKDFVMSSFPGANLKEQFDGLLSYYIPDVNLKWSIMFGIMEEGKRRLNFEDYSLSQTTLEQVFLSFTSFA